jgi:hypothetical protein
MRFQSFDGFMSEVLSEKVPEIIPYDDVSTRLIKSKLCLNKRAVRFNAIIKYKRSK